MSEYSRRVRNRARTVRLTVGPLVAALMACGVRSPTSSPPIPLIYDGPWIAAGFSFGHDGAPWVSEHFTVFSGSSSQSSREYVAEALESHFLEFQGSFDIRSLGELDGWEPSTTIPVLILKSQGTDVLWTGQSFRYGMIVHAPDSPRYAHEGYTPALYAQLLRHELMHVLEYYLVGQGGTYSSVEKWFHEGMAMVMGGTPPNQILDLATVERWRSDMASLAGQGNPVSIKSNADYPAAIQSDAQALGRYYLFFELAVRYLLDPRGLGRTLADVKSLYLAIRDGASFPAAFEACMGLNVASYEAELWTRLEEYLG